MDCYYWETYLSTAGMIKNWSNSNNLWRGCMELRGYCLALPSIGALWRQFMVSSSLRLLSSGG